MHYLQNGHFTADLSFDTILAEIAGIVKSLSAKILYIIILAEFLRDVMKKDNTQNNISISATAMFLCIKVLFILATSFLRLEIDLLHNLLVNAEEHMQYLGWVLVSCRNFDYILDFVI